MNPHHHPQVRIFPFENGWTVGFARGYYSFPSSKAEAITNARQHAARTGVSMIAVIGVNGNVEEWLEAI